MEKVNAINVNSVVDFTLLDARATLADIEKLCDIAYKNQYYSVCVHPANVEFAKGYILKNFDKSLKVATVIGFPLGATTTATKVFEAKNVIALGADEIDVVINIGRAKQGDFEYVLNELHQIRKASKKHIMKVILETCYFDKNEISKLVKVCMKAKVDYVKTSTGFGTGGADIEIVRQIAKETKGKCGIKASGGIRTREFAIDLINAGATRIGTSHLI